MAKIYFIDIIDHAKGKLCEHSNTAFATNSKSGRCYTVTRHPENYNISVSEDQKAKRIAFGAATKTAAAWIKAQKTFDTDGKTVKSYSADYQTMMTAYKAQDKVNGFLAYVRTRIDPDDNQVVMPE